MKSLASFLLILTLPFFSFGSDHIDGAPTLKNGQADLTDLYAFPTPGKSNNLTIILNTYPGVTQTGHFSKKVNYEIEVREIKKASPSLDLLSPQSFDVVKIQCSFTDPGHHHGSSGDLPSKANCQVKKDQELVTHVTEEVGKIGQAGGLKMYTGPRTDAFFLTIGHFQGVTGRKGFPAADPSASNAMHTMNILSMAFELDYSALGLEPTALAVTAQSLDADSKVTIDRVGRGEITNLSLHAFGKAEPLKRSYNQKPPFAVAQSFQDQYQARLDENISAYDLLDGNQNWGDQDLEDLTTLLVNDYLVVDLKGACLLGENEYMMIEKGILSGVEPTSCGGRRPKDDIMATMFALYVGGLNASIDDFQTGVNVPYKGNPGKVLSEEFPYLAAPSETTLLQKMALKFLIHSQE